MIQNWDKFGSLLHIASSFAHPNECPECISLYFLLQPVKSKIFFFSCSLRKKMKTQFVKHADKRKHLLLLLNLADINGQSRESG